MVEEQSNWNKNSQKILDDFCTSINVSAVEVVLYQIAPDIITVEDIVNELSITESRARVMLEDAVTCDTPRINLPPVGHDVYQLQGTS